MENRASPRAGLAQEAVRARAIRDLVREGSSRAVIRGPKPSVPALSFFFFVFSWRYRFAKVLDLMGLGICSLAGIGVFLTGVFNWLDETFQFGSTEPFREMVFDSA